jgi:hypothetical protein
MILLLFTLVFVLFFIWCVIYSQMTASVETDSTHCGPDEQKASSSGLSADDINSWVASLQKQVDYNDRKDNEIRTDGDGDSDGDCNSNNDKNREESNLTENNLTSYDQVRRRILVDKMASCY